MKTVLVALHYQNEVLHAKGKIKVGVGDDDGNRTAVTASAGRLLGAARAAGVPVVSVRIAFRPDHADVIQNAKIFRDVVRNKAMVDGSWGAEFYDGLGPIADEFVVKHTRVNAFYGSQLEEVLRRLKAERLIIAGVATNSVVVTTVTCAVDMGYEVVVAEDACSSGDPANHEAAVRIMQLIADVSTVSDIAGGF